MRNVLLAARIAVLALAAGGAYAVPITTSFTATDFTAGAPTDPVSATIVWEAASPNSTIDSLTSINLTIDGHSYTIGEVGVVSPFTATLDIIGGNLAGVGGMGGGTDDFWLIWNRTTLTPAEFKYASAAHNTSPFFFTSHTFTSLSVTASSVPEPGTLALLGLAWAGLCLARRSGLQRVRRPFGSWHQTPDDLPAARANLRKLTPAVTRNRSAVFVGTDRYSPIAVV